MSSGLSKKFGLTITSEKFSERGRVCCIRGTEADAYADSYGDTVSHIYQHDAEEQAACFLATRKDA
jgi:hypothetical protein